MRPEERFTKIENLLQTLTEKQLEFEVEHGKIQAQLDKFEANLEVQDHAWNGRFQKLWEAHSTLMEAQTSTWAAINQLTANIEKLMRAPGSNGHGE